MRRVAAAAALVIAVAPAASAADVDCLTASTPRLTQVQVTLSLTPDGTKALEQNRSKLAFVHVRRVIAAASEQEASLLEYVRFIDPSGRTPVTFRFGLEGDYTLTVLGTKDYAWPDGTATGEDVGCKTVNISVAPNKQPEFAGVRGHLWGAYRPATRFELGGSVYAERLGFASAAVAKAAKHREPNWLTGVFDVRYRVARGYVGMGVRYFPDIEPDRNRWRPAVDVGEELPTFRGRPLWFVLDLRFDDPQVRPWKALNLSFAARIDFTGTNQP